jgi:hypothetical protein
VDPRGSWEEVVVRCVGLHELDLAGAGDGENVVRNCAHRESVGGDYIVRSVSVGRIRKVARVRIMTRPRPMLQYPSTVLLQAPLVLFIGHPTLYLFWILK